MSYPGGKAAAGVYQTIINQIPPHDVYCEPFLGDGAILRRKRPARRNIAVELDRSVAEGFCDEDVAAQFAGTGLEVHCCCGIEWLKHHFRLYRVPGADAAAGGDESGGSRSRAARDAEFAARAQPQKTSAGSAAAEFRGNGRRPPVNGTARYRTFVYCDPPYLLSTRRSGKLYRCELTDEQHEDLLDVIRRLPCDVAISGYSSPLYEEALQEWRCLRFPVITRGGRPAMESLWMNYPPPAELHDYRYLGQEKRERERISRKVRTWVKGLQRLPALERQAILDAIARRDF